MRVLLYLLLVPIMFIAFVFGMSLLSGAIGLFAGLAAILLESVTVGVVNFLCAFASDEQAARMRK